MTAAAATRTELASLIARGDRKRAASLLVRDHAAAVFALCRAMVRDPRLAEDLSQDAFARALGALDGFRGEASPRTWLLKIARNRCLDHLDRARRAPWVGGGDPEPDDHAADEPPPYDLLARREDAERAMAVLGESERALVVLHFGHGVGYPELADSFGLREGAVRMRISRALARMRAALAPELDGAHPDFEREAPTPAWGEGGAARRASGLDAGDDDRALFDADTFAQVGDEVAGLGEDTELGLADERGGDTELGLADERGGDTELGLADELAEITVGTLRSAWGELAEEAALPDVAPPTFDAIREEVSPALRRQLDALAAAA